MSAPDEQPKRKRIRLAMSCERCRKRKIRCDLQDGGCGPCTAANADCIVADGKERMPTGSNALNSSGNAPSSSGGSNRGRADSKGKQTDSPDGLSQMDLSFLQTATADINAATSNVPSSSGNQPVAYNRVAFSPSVLNATAGPSNSTSNLKQASTSGSRGTSKSGSRTIQQVNINTTANEERPAEQQWQSHFNDAGLIHTLDHRRKFIGASSNQVFLKWLDAESKGAKLASHFKHAVGDAEEFVFPGLDDFAAPLPSGPDLARYIDAYFSHVHPLYPCLDEKIIRNAADLYPLVGLSDDNPPMEILIPLLYLVISLGADFTSGHTLTTETGTHYLRLAWKALPSILARPYRSAVQALILLGLAAHHRGRDGVCWNVIGYATRIAYGLGLHLQRHDASSNLDARIWYSVYSIDKALSFDAGRPTSIRDDDCTTTPAALSRGDLGVSDQQVKRYPIFETSVSLYHQISHICTSLFSQKAGALSPIDILKRIGQCDAQLEAWANALPEKHRPRDEPRMQSSDYALLSYVHITYHQAIIALHRMSLFTDLTTLVTESALDQLGPYVSRLRHSKSICLSSARAIIAIIDRLGGDLTARRHWSLHNAMTAVYVIAINIYRSPTSWQAQADLMLLRSACSYLENSYRDMNFHPEFVSLLPAIAEKVEQKVRYPTMPSRPPTPTRSAAPPVDLSVNQYVNEHQVALDNSSNIQIMPIPEQSNVDAASYNDMWNTSLQGMSMPFDSGYDTGNNNDFQDLLPFLFGGGGLPSDTSDYAFFDARLFENDVGS